MKKNKGKRAAKPRLSRTENLYCKTTENTRLICDPRRATQQTVRRYFKRWGPVSPQPLQALQSALRPVPRVTRGSTVSREMRRCAKLSACHAQRRAGLKNSVPAFESFVVNRFRKRARKS